MRRGEGGCIKIEAVEDLVVVVARGRLLVAAEFGRVGDFKEKDG